jgi:glutamine cyclotransferase
MVGNANDNIYEYTCSTAFDIGTASYSKSLDVSGQDTAPQGMTWNNDGTKLYMVGNDTANIYEYTCSTAFDIGTASLNQSLDVSGQDTIPTGMAWNDTGTKLYMVGNGNDSIYEYTCSTAFDIGTASYSKSLDVSGQDTIPQGMAWNNDGTKLYMVGRASDSIYEYNCSTAFDVGTASFSQSLDVSGQDTIPRGIAWNDTGTKLYMVGNDTANIYEYTSNFWAAVV